LTTDEIEQFALANGHPPAADGVVCVDFDGTIAPWGDLFGFPAPLDGAVEFVNGLTDAGYTVYIFTSRLSAYWHMHEGRDPANGIFHQVRYLQEYCERYGLNVAGATAEKVPAIAYIDDKAIEYNDWAKVARKFRRKAK
jgi:hypothetical protein